MRFIFIDRGGDLSRVINIALAGNPNSGKTTIFNSLTGLRQHVGNYPGVTVEKKEGRFSYAGHDFNIVDLPGTYGLTAYSIEEIVARDYIVDEKPDVVVNIVDVSNLERNLYLTTQLMELNVPIIVVFNMMDIAEKRGYEMDLDLLSKLIGLPIVPTIGNKSDGVGKLKSKIIEMINGEVKSRPREIDYGVEVEKILLSILPLLGEERLAGKYNPRWIALKLLEGDEVIAKFVSDKAGNRAEILSAVGIAARHIKTVIGDRPEIVIADRRYGFISGACQEAVKSTVELRHQISDKIDAILTHRFFGLPIFLFMMYLAFTLTFTLGEPLMGMLETFFGWLSELVSGFWAVDSASPLKSLLVDGIIGGVGGVIVFLPNILLLFLAISILEDSGYMSRAAFIMDSLMHRIGLHGKSFIPMLVGFGCTVPAIMATRILESRRDRLTTMLVMPLISCGARFPIYALIIPAFFPAEWSGPILWIIYLIGIVLAILLIKILRSTAFKGPSEPFVMELPPYRVPPVLGVALHMWGRGWMYLKKAGTIILGMSILMWALTNYPAKDISDDYSPEQMKAIQIEHSAAGHIAKFSEPVLKPLGFDWKIGTALMGSLAAKEVFVSQMGIVFSVSEADGDSDSLRERLQESYSPLTGFCIMLFCLIATPCIATVAVTWRESGSWKWAALQFGGLTTLAYIITLITYQVGSLLRIGI